ncbi:MAG: Na+-transporting NADH:ubiquinone oxidoreductase subunit A [Pseudomonadales bacterium]|jgi:Na+-transporting NADH:ubiquinone oxidoreductase subunit A
MIKIKKGLDLPIAGQPEQKLVETAAVKTVALVGADYVGMKPTMEVSEGDKVKKGQLLFTDKKTEGVKYTAPGGGTVVQVNRGAKRVFQTLVIELDEQEEELTFASFSAGQLAGLNREQVTHQLVDSGEWTAFRTRPYSKVPAASTVPHSIFVNAMDTNPLAADPVVVIAQNKEAFANGLKVLPALTDGNVYLSTAPDADIPSEGATVKEFAGPHPAGLSGTHIHFIDPVSFNKTVWTIGYQDVIAIGHLFTSGKIYSERVVALAGPAVNAPALVKTRVGASTTELTAGNLVDGDNRVISGSVLSGRSAKGVMAYLGRYHYQISVLAEGVERKFMGWLSPGLDRFSVMGIYLSQLIGGKRFAMNTSTNGSPRAMVPIGAYEKLMPLDILPTQLLRAMIVADMEVSLDLGVLELDEEDLALCTFACPGKYEYGPILRDNLTRIEKEC